MQPRGHYNGEVLVLRPAKWLRLMSWGIVGCGFLVVAIRVVVLVEGAWAGLIAMAGGLACSICLPIARSRVVCDPAGISYRLFGRERRFPREQIADLLLRPVPGAGPVSRAEIEVALKDGERVWLDPSLIVRSGPDNTVLRQHIATMSGILRLPADRRRAGAQVRGRRGA